jgi:hypothetical protein
MGPPQMEPKIERKFLENTNWIQPKTVDNE